MGVKFYLLCLFFVIIKYKYKKGNGVGVVLRSFTYHDVKIPTLCTPQFFLEEFVFRADHKADVRRRHTAT